MRRAPKNHFHALSFFFSFFHFYFSLFLLNLIFLFIFSLSHFVSFIPPAVKAKRNAVNFSYNVGRGKLDYPSLFFSFLFFLFWFYPPLRYRLRSSFFRRLWFRWLCRLLLDTWNFSVFCFIFFLFSWRKGSGQKARSGGRNSDTRFLFPSLALSIFFFFFPIVSRVKRRVEVEKVGLYAFFTLNQEPRSCSGGWVWRGMFTGTTTKSYLSLVSCFVFLVWE